MEDKYMMFLDKEQLAYLEGALESALDYAIRTGQKQLMILTTALLMQVRKPRKLKPKTSGWGEAIRSQFLGK